MNTNRLSSLSLLCKNIMSPKICVTKFTVNDKPVYIKLLWTQNEENLFEMHLFDGNHCWTGAFTNESAEKIKKKCENPENYSNDVLSCLTGEDGSYTFKFVPEENIAKFSWSKKFEGLTQVIGSLMLYKDMSVDKLSFIDFLVDENRNLQHTITELKKSSDIVNEELIKCRSELEKFLESKTALESLLCGKFVKLLNAKKRKIRLLENHIRSLGDGSYED